MKRRKKENRDDDDNGFAAWGGYMEAKKSKLLGQFHDAAKNVINKQSNLFNGISIFVNGYTNPTAEELKQIMVLHGGIYHNYYRTTKTTYIIASNLPDAKIKQMGPNQKIIKPEWIVDCLQQNKILDYTKYLLYTNCNRRQPRLNFENVVKHETDTKVENKDEDNIPLSPEMFGSYDENTNNSDTKTVENGLPDKTLINLNNIEYIQNSNLKLLENKKESIDKPGRTLTANDPKFLSEFYNNSRLHHISTLGATFKQHICNLREEANFKFPERVKIKEYLQSLQRDIHVNNYIQKQTVIMHIDMDCFFVSVGLRKRPDLKGIPVAVTHSKGGQEPSYRSGVNRQAELDCYKQRVQEKLKLKNLELGPGNMLSRLEGIENQSMSEIASCSYEARKAGVKNGMFMGTALKLCPNLRTIPYDFEGYKEVAYTLYNTISEYTLNIEAVSCDEMFVDITELLKETGMTVHEWATYIRKLIQQRTGCPCSTGFGQNRLQARVATKTAKPNGQFHLILDAVEEYMVDIKVRDLPGVGHSTSLKLESFGVKTCGDLQSMSIGQLRSEFGNKIGESLYNHCRGIDDRHLVYEHERKSVSAEINYGIRFTSNTEAETFLKQLVIEVHSRLTEIKMKGKCITLKLMVRSKDAPQESSKFMGHGICDYITKSNSLPVATNELSIIEREILSISLKLSVPPQDLRGIGIQISKLEKIKNVSEGITKFFNSVNTSKTSIVNKFQNRNIQCNTINNVIKSKKEHSETNLNLDTNAIETIVIHDDESLEQNPIITVNNENITNTEQRNEKKDSPVKSNQKFFSKRGRGRSRGRGGKTIERKGSNNGNLTKYLAAPNVSPIKKTVQEPFNLNGVDMEVFAALPEDIQKEILAQYHLNANQVENEKYLKNTNNIEEVIEITENTKEQDKNENKTNKNDPQNNNILEKSTKTESIQSSSNNSESDNCMFSKMSMKELKQLIENWISSQNTPENCDVKMLGEYFKQLALNKKIRNLFEILKFLFSEISFKNTCGWHKAYFQIVNIAQEGMLAKYGNNIWIYKDFKCGCKE